jgi:hypothetical protein
LLEQILKQIGFDKIYPSMIPSSWDYPSQDIALRGLLSLGAVSKAIENSGIEKVKEVVSEAIQPFVQTNGRVIYRNEYKIFIAEK